MSAPRGCPPVQWEQAIGLARHTCAKVYRDGGSPAEALFSAGADNSADASWDTAIRALARQFCQR